MLDIAWWGRIGDHGVMYELVHFERAYRALQQASSIDEAKDIRDKAEAARAYARQIGLSLEMQNQCCEIKLRAERRMGELLGASPRQKPGQYQRSHDATVAPALAEMGVSKTQSSRWQALARLPKREFEGFITETKGAGRELTTTAALKLAKQREARQQVFGLEEEGTPRARGKVATSLEALAKSKTRFGCILADPPWRYGNQGTRASTDNHYDTLSVEEIAALPVGELAAKNAHLHLWTTNAFLFEAREVMEAWGFTYKSVLVWVKPEMGLGNYWRVSHEFMLLGVRGKAPFRSKSHKSWFEEPRTEHSAKPERVREMLEEVSGGPYLELFARKRSPRWRVWGNQIGSKT